MLGQRLAAPTRATHLMAAVHGPMGTVLQLAQPEMQRAPRYPRGPGDQGRPAVAKRFGFGGDPEATSPFVHHRCQSEKLFPNDCFHGCLVHGEILEHFTVLYELFMDSYLATLPACASASQSSQAARRRTPARPSCTAASLGAPEERALQTYADRVPLP